MKKLAGLLSCSILAHALSAADIAWTVRPNTCSDSDVRTEGRCLYAYTPSTEEVNVNGVQFSRWTILEDNITVNGITHTTYAVKDFADDASFDTSITRNRNVNWLGDTQTAAWTGSDGYRKLLSWAWYSGEKNRTLTLKGLTIGKRYLVQIWMCDARATTTSSKKLTIGGKTGDCYGNGFGSNFVGEFTADAKTQDIALTYTSEPNFTAFQVRCLDEAHISWRKSWTQGEGDVCTEGALVYAYKPYDSLRISNVPFVGCNKSNPAYFGLKNAPDIAFSKPLGAIHKQFLWSSADVPSGAYSYSVAYSNLLSSGFHGTWNNGARYNRRDVTLRNLKAGSRYLVQLWVFDNRSGTYSSRSVVVGNGVVLTHSDGTSYGHGSMAIGTFTATSSEQTFSCYHREAGEAMKASQEVLGPIQVRCLDEDCEERIVGDTQADGSVDTRGQPLYAFSGLATEVAGTPFASFGDGSGEYMDLAVKSNGLIVAGNCNKSNPFININIPQGVPVSPAVSNLYASLSPSVTNLLAGGLHSEGGVVERELELRRLVPGRRYLVQAWFMDVRARRPYGHFWSMPVHLRICNNDYFDYESGSVTYEHDKAPLGQYATCIFRATNSVCSIPFASRTGQLNAVQVRALETPVDSEIRWTVGETQSSNASLSTEGTTLYAYAPQAFTLGGVDFAEGFKQKNDLGNDGNVVLARYFVESAAIYAKGREDSLPSDSLPLFNNGWYNYNASEDNRGTNTVTLCNLKPTYSYVVQLFVADLRIHEENGVKSCPFGNRTLMIKGYVGRFGPNSLDDTAYPYGSVFTGRFTADSTTKSFEMKFGNDATSLLNAIQVREIGPAHAVRDLNASADWTVDGNGWLVGGKDQSGATLWDEAHGQELAAYVDGDAEIGLGSDVTFGALYASGSVTIGEIGTEHGISCLGDIHAPLATINAVWMKSHVRKTSQGTMALAGKCPELRLVDVRCGRLVLDGEIPHSLDVSVFSPGEIGFSSVRALDLSRICGDGKLAGPGGIRIANGETFEIPKDINYANGFAWSLANGSKLVLPAGYDASNISVYVEKPSEYANLSVVSCIGEAVGKPTFAYGEDGWRAVRSVDGAGWVIKGAGFAVTIR